MFGWIEGGLAVIFGIYWRAVLLALGAIGFIAVAWNGYRKRDANPKTLRIAIVGAIFIFTVLATYVFWKG